MIHFRYHLVSLIAVFLALAIGVAMGATVIDKAIVDALRVQVNSAERRADSIKRENDSLKNERAQDASFLQSVSKATIAGRLDGAHVQFIAAKGLDEASVSDLVKAVESAGGSVGSVLWLARDFNSQAHRQAQQSILGSSASKRFWNAVYAGIGSTQISESPSSSSTSNADTTSSSTTSVAPNAREQLDALVAAGILQETNRSKEAPRATDLVIVLGGPASAQASAAVVSSAEIAATNRLAVVVGEIWDPTAETADAGVGSTLIAIRNDDDLRDRVATIDSLNDTNGRLLLVLVAEAALAGRVGQYGYGLGARDGIVPGPA